MSLESVSRITTIHRLPAFLFLKWPKILIAKRYSGSIGWNRFSLSFPLISTTFSLVRQAIEKSAVYVICHVVAVDLCLLKSCIVHLLGCASEVDHSREIICNAIEQSNSTVVTPHLYVKFWRVRHQLSTKLTSTALRRMLLCDDFLSLLFGLWWTRAYSVCRVPALRHHRLIQKPLASIEQNILTIYCFNLFPPLLFDLNVECNVEYFEFTLNTINWPSIIALYVPSVGSVGSASKAFYPMPVQCSITNSNFSTCPCYRSIVPEASNVAKSQLRCYWSVLTTIQLSSRADRGNNTAHRTIWYS